MSRIGLTPSKPIEIVDDSPAPVFRLTSVVPKRPAREQHDSDIEEGGDMDLSFGAESGETLVTLEEDAVPPLGQFDEVFALLRAERERALAKLQRTKLQRNTDGPDLLHIPYASPVKQRPAQPFQRVSASGTEQAMDMAPLKSAIDDIGPPPAAKIPPISMPLRFKATKPSEVVRPRAVERLRESTPQPEASTSSATSSAASSPGSSAGDVSTTSTATAAGASRVSADFYDRYVNGHDSSDDDDANDRRPPESDKLPLDVRVRASGLLRKLARLFPRESASFARAEALGAGKIPEGASAPVSIFIDFSNIHVGFLDWCARRPHTAWRSGKRRRPKLDLHSLFAILERGRHARRRILVGSRPLAQGLELAQEWQYELHILDRVHKKRHVQAGFGTDSAEDSSDVDGRHRGGRTTMREQAVDEVLQLKLYETVTRPPSQASGRPVIVLATGDGARSEYSEDGFVGPVRIALAAGFDVELFAFAAGLSSTWRREADRAERAGKVMGTLTVVELDGFGAELVAT